MVRCGASNATVSVDLGGSIRVIHMEANEMWGVKKRAGYFAR